MGILGKITPVAGVDTLLYKCGAGKQAVVTVTVTNTTSATGEATLSIVAPADLSVASIAVSTKGTGLTSIPTLAVATATGKNSTNATAVVSSISLSETGLLVGGTGYAVGAILTVSGGTGTAATVTVTAVDANGAVTAVSVLNGGSYTAVITGTNAATTSNGTGTGCTLTVAGLKYGINTITVTTNGNGYIAAPTITPSAGSGAIFLPAMTTVVETTDAIDYKVQLAINGGFMERSALVVAAGEAVFIKTNNSGTNAFAIGVETIA